MIESLGRPPAKVFSWNGKCWKEHVSRRALSLELVLVCVVGADAVQRAHVEADVVGESGIMVPFAQVRPGIG